LFIRDPDGEYFAGGGGGAGTTDSSRNTPNGAGGIGGGGAAGEDGAPTTGGGGGFAGAAGTVYLKTADGSDTLIIDGNNIWASNNTRIIYSSRVTTLMPPAPNAVDLNAFAQVEIKRRGQLGVGASTTLDFGSFAPTTHGADASYIALHDDTGVTYPADWTIDGYTLFVNTIAEEKNLTNITIGATGALSHFQNVNTEIHKLDLTIPGNLTIQSGGAINADDRGYNRYGPGHLNDSYGAAHGGTALMSSHGGGQPLVNPKVYGSIFNPVNVGSRGHPNEASAGGAVMLTVGGTTQVMSPGRISVNANGGNRPGSGGSILLRTGSLTGDGAIQAHGCSVTWNNGIGGGGGRIAVYLTGTGEDFAGWTGTITAYGGTANSSPMPRRHGAAGTVYRQLAAQADGAGTVTVDNTTRAKNEAWTTLPAFAGSTENLERTAWVTANNARIGLVTNVAIDRIDINTDGVLDLNGFTLTLKAATLGGVPVGSGVHTAASLDSPFVTDESDPQTGQLVIPPPGSLFLLR